MFIASDKRKRKLIVIGTIVVTISIICAKESYSKLKEEKIGEETLITAEFYESLKKDDKVSIKVIGKHDNNEVILEFKPTDFGMIEEFAECSDKIYYEILYFDKSKEVLDVNAFNKDDKKNITFYTDKLLETVCKK